VVKHALVGTGWLLQPNIILNSLLALKNPTTPIAERMTTPEKIEASIRVSETHKLANVVTTRHPPSTTRYSLNSGCLAETYIPNMTPIKRITDIRTSMNDARERRLVFATPSLCKNNS
jgi:hypothetical protein